jgi:predicted O-methyltransferase YrrM
MRRRDRVRPGAVWLRLLTSNGRRSILSTLPVVLLLVAPLTVISAILGAELGILVPTASALALVLIILLDHTASLKYLRSAILRLERQEAALWAIPLATDSPMARPWLGGFALSPTTAAALVRLVAEVRPQRIVELGPGQSTLLLLQLRQQLHLDFSITAIEHDPGYFARLQALLAALPDSDAVRLVHAPLGNLAIPGWVGSWYQSEAVDAVGEDVDIILVDGPPHDTAASARYPALQFALRHLKDGGLLLLDDADRPGEAAVVNRWLTEEPRLTLVSRSHEWALLRVDRHYPS